MEFGGFAGRLLISYKFQLDVNKALVFDNHRQCSLAVCKQPCNSGALVHCVDSCHYPWTCLKVIL